MGYEVDIIGVGQESKSGDAIALRWGNLYGQRQEQRVVIIDGGFLESGQALVDHVKAFYGTDRVDVVISTHPDLDHISGLDVVLDNLHVQQLWIHQPWKHNLGLSNKFADGRVTDASIGKRLRESLDVAANLVDKAQGKGIITVEPFSGLSLYNENQLQILGPTIAYYESLIPKFDDMPQMKESAKNLISVLAGNMVKPKTQLYSTWGVDALDDEDTTSAKNNTSVITQLIVEGYRLLFTGDAGITALSHAVDNMVGFPQTAKLRLMQIPHHGSRRNLGPTILNRLVGLPLPYGFTRNLSAVASTARYGDSKHPHKAVIYALTHRGANVLATKGKTTGYANNAPYRFGWNTVTPEQYYWIYDNDV